MRKIISLEKNIIRSSLFVIRLLTDWIETGRTATTIEITRSHNNPCEEFDELLGMMVHFNIEDNAHIIIVSLLTSMHCLVTFVHFLTTTTNAIFFNMIIKDYKLYTSMDP